MDFVTKHYIWFVVFIMVLGFGLRYQWATNHHGEDSFRWTFADEFSYYVSTATNAFNGKGFVPEYNQQKNEVYVPPPGQSFFILALFRLRGGLVHPFFLQLAQIALSLVMIGLCAKIGRALSNQIGGLSFAFLVAIYPSFVFWPAYMMTESNFLVGLSFIFYLLIRWVKDPTALNALFAALVMGLLHYQRVNFFYFWFFLSILCFLWFPRKKAATFAGIFIVVPYLVLTPWLLRNIEKYNDPVWVNSNGGVLFHVGNNINLNPTKTPFLHDVYTLQKPSPFIPEIESQVRDQGRPGLHVTWHRYSKMYMGVAKKYILHHPFHFAKNYLIKFIHQFTLPPTIGHNPYTFFKGVTADYFWLWVITGGGFAGLFYCFRTHRKREFILLAAGFAYVALLGGFFLLTRDGRMTLNQKWFLMAFLSAAFGHWFQRKVPGFENETN